MTFIYKVVLTGAPCSGKTSVLNAICENFNKLEGTRVIVVNETASELSNGNIKPEECLDSYAFQEELYKVQKAKEEAAERLASKFPESYVLIVYDRGILDNRAYLDRGQFETMLYDNNDSEMQILDKYDMVINLMSAANIEGMYNKDTNPARSEDGEIAKKLDKKTLDSWLFSRNLYNIEATENFDDKVQRVLEIIKDGMFGVGKKKYKYSINPNTIKKYLIDNSVKCIYEEDYMLLDAPNNKLMVSKRFKGNDVSYSLVDQFINNECEGRRVEKGISEREFISWISCYPPIYAIGKNIYRFVYDNQIFEVVKANDMYYIELINKEPNKEVNFPPELANATLLDNYLVVDDINKYARKRYLK